MEYTKTYGIQKGFHKGIPRFFVVCDGKCTSLHYAKADFAMAKAKIFCHACYKNWRRDNGEMVTFKIVAT